MKCMGHFSRDAKILYYFYSILSPVKYLNIQGMILSGGNSSVENCSLDYAVQSDVISGRESLPQVL